MNRDIIELVIRISAKIIFVTFINWINAFLIKEDVRHGKLTKSYETTASVLQIIINLAVYIMICLDFYEVTSWVGLYR